MKKEKFISIIFKTNPKESDVLLLIDFLKGLIGNYINPTFKDSVLTVFFDAACEISFKEIIQSLNEDFYITALLFESGELYKEIDKNEYMNHIKESRNLLFEINNLYITEADLIKNKIYKDVIVRNILKDFHNDYEMKKVVKVYLECNMNISKAANELFMHRNTLMYKIDKFVEITGYDIRKFHNAFVIYHII